ncbi:MAG: hypothetical protein HC786_09025 [Richelia sp. CSU_2_1]|nr:hypothetical protein [Richelia sp. CSU_2_1]
MFKKEEGRRKKEEGRRKKEEGRRKICQLERLKCSVFFVCIEVSIPLNPP